MVAPIVEALNGQVVYLCHTVYSGGNMQAMTRDFAGMEYNTCWTKTIFKWVLTASNGKPLAYDSHPDIL